jgi:hypothetical protein
MRIVINEDGERMLVQDSNKDADWIKLANVESALEELRIIEAVRRKLAAAEGGKSDTDKDQG